MVRERLNAIDVAISVANLKKTLDNITLVNIYDITNRLFILKFSRNENKIYVLIEIGCRIHTTQFLRSVDHLPSNFNAKLRKHLRNRRLRDVKQMSQDRIIDFTFSSEEHAMHLIVQLFLPGNIYLTDHEYKVLAVLKPKNTGDNFFKVGTNYVCDMEYNSWFEPVKRTLVEELVMGNKLTDLVKTIFPSIHNGFILSVLKMNGNAEEDVKKLDRVYAMDELDVVYEYVEAVRQCLVGLLTRKDIVPGYIYRNAKGVMDDFGPFELQNAEYHEDYNYALDAFFTKNELVKQEKKTESKKPTKLTKIKADQDKRESKLMEEIMGYDKQIRVLEENIDIVDNCLNLTKALIASGASWNDIYEQLQIQRKQNHPLVCYIKEINIPNQTLVFVSNPEGNERDDEPERKELVEEQVVVLDYRLTGYQNLKKFYINRKKAENKLERTKIGKEYALKKVAKSLSKQPEVKKGDRRTREVKISSLRKRFWFEKFYWFITSQGYLVLAGRDSLQNELLVKKYLTKGDLYFHADIHGASSVILKTNSQELIKSSESAEVSEVEKAGGRGNEEEFIAKIRVSIEEAANFAVCHSNAWNDKFSVQSWWVYWHQVSKTPPTGEYVPQGSFVIRGKKNYLQPQKLEMGITYLFQVHPFQTLDNQEEAELAAKEEAGNHGVNDERNEQEDEEDEQVGQGGEEVGEYSSTDDVEEDEEDYMEQENEDYDDDEINQREYDEEENYMEDNYEGEEEDEEDMDGALDQEGESVDSVDEEDEEDTYEVDEDINDNIDHEDKSVRMGNVVTIGECEANIVKRTRGRLATAYPLKAQLNKLKDRLEMLNLTKSSGDDEEEEEEEEEESSDEEAGRTVKIMEPERVSHTEEAIRKIRQRKATCVSPNLSELRKLINSENNKMDSDEEEEVGEEDEEDDDGSSASMGGPKGAAVKVALKAEHELNVKKSSNRAMRLMSQKASKVKKKYAQDDEETQELRRMLTGSKKMKQRTGAATKTSFQVGPVTTDRAKESRLKGRDKEIPTISDRELETYMKQLSCLSRELKEDDDVLSVIPMCAPYSAIKHYRHVLKLVPGNAKKGTIATQSLQHFVKNDAQNAHYLKLITTDQLTLTLIGNCKFTNAKM
ncbi:uncharacterized protein TOT_030000383 [Theileria orientalis strain Shintoku]|uniref:Ribosome quality control complex subunit 2 n=1 Tax=Theileria orientalis strain Shintoku TaxID=869250 RepID=J4D906_THEOR|nr:uncharacterized protein TOT_030000383 [Theileria orientalis strain Shintoku]BAM41120.1 uncharacterized protein TOT_030000383 [Theileria orientalis strain Shintoku]|eukprot:XP_009691421.1 uncharacterized protein TOT_030000383 [Theileria orientalis strain Shintoku]